ncbi:glycoside hydrolase family protein [Shewanella algae]|uniref:glycoside hydrolase family protein n=1 Tax=Shewanella algae TaxID=38313 RepID=UPI000F42B5BE|nr:glycoside hydrolase family protein [Shewanella algae]AYV12975.1 lysozyme [Shewanella algae]
MQHAPLDIGITHTTSLPAKAVSLLMSDEGFRDTAYHCSEGYPTIGYGQRIGPKNAPLYYYSFFISEPIARAWLTETVSRLARDIRQHPDIAPAMQFTSLSRSTILLCMSYQLGVRGLAGFKKMLAAAAKDDWQEAARQARDSRWARQTPTRAMRYARVLETGEL